MRITVRLFAQQRELTGTRRRSLAIAEGATVGEAWAALVGELPALATSTASVRFARNGAYVGTDERLVDGDELAVIPPVAGGSGSGGGPASGSGSGGGSARGDGPASGSASGPAGGDGPASGSYRRIELRDPPLDDGLLDELRHAVATEADGAVAIFLGQTRETPGTPAPGQEAAAARVA